MTSIRLQRYDFGSLRDFRGPVPATLVPNEAVVEAPPPPPPVFSEADLASSHLAGHQRGYSEGFEAGLARAAEQADAQRIAVETTLQHMAHLLQGLQHGYQQLIDHETAELSTLVTLIAKKVAGEALDANTSEVVLAMVKQCLPLVVAKPRLQVELNPALFEATMDRIESLLKANGFEGEVQFRANPAMNPHDVLLDWGTGQATRNTATMWQEVEALLATMPIKPAPLLVNDQLPPEAPAAETLTDDITPSEPHSDT